jgi:hypothetical protein
LPSFRSPHQNPVCTSLFPHISYYLLIFYCITCLIRSLFDFRGTYWFFVDKNLKVRHKFSDSFPMYNFICLGSAILEMKLAEIRDSSILLSLHYFIHTKCWKTLLRYFLWNVSFVEEASI